MILKSQAKGFYLGFTLLTLAVGIITWRINPNLEQVDTLTYSSSSSWTIPIQWKATLLSSDANTDPIYILASDESRFYRAHDTGWILKHNAAGDELWSFFASEATSGFMEAIAKDKDSIYVLSRRGALYCFDAGTGSPRWIHNFGESTAGDLLPFQRWLFVALARGNFTVITKVDGNTGQLVWKSQPLEIPPEQVTLKPHQGQLTVTQSPGRTILLKLSDGTLL